MTSDLVLYNSAISGNGYKVRLLLHQLETPSSSASSSTSRAARRARPSSSPRTRNGRIPPLVLDDGTTLAESNAIQFYLAEGTPLLARGQRERAQVLQWMFFEQYSHEPYIAVVRFWCHTERGERAARWSRCAARAATMRSRDGGPPPPRDFFAARPLHDRRHRALRLHPRRARGRLRPRALSGSRLARARARPAAPHPDHGLIQEPRQSPRSRSSSPWAGSAALRPGGPADRPQTTCSIPRSCRRNRSRRRG